MERTDWRRDPWVNLAAEFVLRIVYAVAPMIAIIFLVGGSSPRHATRGNGATALFTPEFWVLLLVVGAISAAVGPWLYRRSTYRGRGTLARIRRMSGRGKSGGRSGR